MNTEGDYFAEYFTLAQTDALKDRESRIIELRYGFMGGDPHTLEEIGQEFGISRERVRQILKKSHRKILSRGQRQVKSGRADAPCAQLLLFIQSVIRPSDDGAIDRLVNFVEDTLHYLPVSTHALPLVTYLAYQSQKSAKLPMVEARKLIWERAFARSKRRRRRKQWEKFHSLLSYVVWPREVRCQGSRHREHFSGLS